MIRRLSPLIIFLAVGPRADRARALDRAPGPAGLMDRLDQRLEDADDLGSSWRAPHFEAADMYGHPVSLDQFRGRILILSFLTPAARQEALAWLKTSQVDYLGDPGIAFVNVLFPGPTSVFNSRRSLLRQARDQIEQAYRRFHDQLRPGDRERLVQTDIRWILDWRMELLRRYDVQGDNVQLFIIDGRGDVRQVIRRRTPDTAALLPRTIESLRHGGIEPEPGDPSTERDW